MNNIEMDNIFDSPSEDGSETLPVEEVYQKIQTAWTNEKLCPELLPHQQNLVDGMLQYLKEQEESLISGDFKSAIVKMEIDRVRFIIFDLLRTRLRKIEQYPAYIIQKCQSDVDGGAVLTPEEYAFASQYLENLETHLKSEILFKLPQHIQTIDWDKAGNKPDLDKYVFMRVLEFQEGFLIEDEAEEARDEIIDLEPDSQHLIRFKNVSDLLKSEKIVLI